MKYLFCPMSSSGFVFPSIGIAKLLIRRGHQVAFVTGRSFDKIFEREGLERIPNGTRDTDCFTLPKWTWLREVSKQVRYITSAIQEFNPDVLVGTVLGKGAPVASELRGVPLSIIGFATYLWALPDVLALPDSLRSQSDRFLVNMLESDVEEHNQLRMRFKLTQANAPSREMPMLGDLFLMQNVPELVGNPQAFPPQVHFVGCCLWDECVKDSELDEWMDKAIGSGDPILYVQPGAYFDKRNFWPDLVDALAGKSIRVVGVCWKDVRRGRVSST